MRKSPKIREKIKKHANCPVSLAIKMWYTSTVDGGLKNRICMEAVENSLEKNRMIASGSFL
jgi:hypothetical protein